MLRSHRHLRALGRVPPRQIPLLLSCSPPAAPRRSHARGFQSLGLSRDLVQRLAAIGVTNPTPAQCQVRAHVHMHTHACVPNRLAGSQQRMLPCTRTACNGGSSYTTKNCSQAIPAALRRQDVVVAAETGGGKTLAYLLPLLEQLRAEPLPLENTHRPVGLVLTTSQELVRQVAAVLAAVQPELARHTVVLSSTNQSLSRTRACPLVIATPHALLRACKPKDFAFTRTIVVDEADMLLSGGFEKDTKQILATIRNQPLLLARLNDCERARRQRGAGALKGKRDDDGGVKDEDGRDDSDDDDDDETIDGADISSESRQTIFMHATIPDYGKRSVREFIARKFPSAVFAVTEGFQRTLPRLDMRFLELEKAAVAGEPTTGSFLVDSNGAPESPLESARKALVWEVLTDAQQAPTNTLVFANSVASADELFAFLDAQVQHRSSAGSLEGSEASVAFPSRVLLFHKEVDRQQRQKVLALLDDERAHVVV
ncbi:hypothetical protein PybrP1_003024, partial [[Pythium] brassicae (nom. inval.)]